MPLAEERNFFMGIEMGGNRIKGLDNGWGIDILENLIAGWSSPVARRAHNPKVAGSNPAPATKLKSLKL